MGMGVQYTTPVLTAGPDAAIFDVLRQMQANSIKHIVVESGGRPAGMVTERDISRFLENDGTGRALGEIPIKHVMQKNVILVSDGAGDHFNQCATRMETFRIGSVVLVDGQGSLIGIVTKTDIARAYAAIYGAKFKVGDYMSKVAVTCRKSDSLQFALDVINRNGVSRLVVTDENGAPVGLISTNTFLNHSDYFSKGQTRSRDYLLPIGGPEGLAVSDLMAGELLTITAGEDLALAAGLMTKNRIGGIPVVDQEKNLLGVISKSDIVRAFIAVGSHEELRSKYRDFY